MSWNRMTLEKSLKEIDDRLSPNEIKIKKIRKGYYMLTFREIDVIVYNTGSSWNALVENIDDSELCDKIQNIENCKTKLNMIKYIVIHVLWRYSNLNNEKN